MNKYFDENLKSSMAYFLLFFGLLFGMCALFVFNSPFSYSDACTHKAEIDINKTKFTSNDIFEQIFCPVEPPKKQFIDVSFTGKYQVIDSQGVWHDVQPDSIDVQYKRQFVEFWLYFFKSATFLILLYLSAFCISLTLKDQYRAKIMGAVQWALFLFIGAVCLSVYVKFKLGWF